MYGVFFDKILFPLQPNGTHISFLYQSVGRRFGSEHPVSVEIVVIMSLGLCVKVVVFPQSGVTAVCNKNEEVRARV